MSCYSTITGDERVYFYYDTSGSIGSADLASLRAAVAEIISLLVVAGIDPANISEVDSNSERYLTWFTQSADNYLVVAFINEANPSYHGETTDTGPTAQWTSDYGTFKSHIAARTFRGLIYALDVDNANPTVVNAVHTFNFQHAPRAVAGTHGYPAGKDSLRSLGVRLNANVQIGRTATAYAHDILDFLTGWLGGGFCERIRADVVEDAGSIFQATEAIAVEAGIRESYPLGTHLRPGRLHPFRELLTPADNSHRFYPIPTRNEQSINTYDGETNLGRMANVYPPAVMTRIEDEPYFGGATEASVQEILSYLFTLWSQEYDWFSYEDVPDLRLLVPGAIGNERQYYVDNPEDGVVKSRAVALPQVDNQRQSMREIVDEVLSIFPGTIVRQNSFGSIEIVPRVGPDALDEPQITLAWRDILSISDGEDDPRGVINRCRVESRGYEFQDEQVVAPPSYYLLRHSTLGLEESVLEEEDVMPLDRERIGFREALEFTLLTSPAVVEVTANMAVYGSHSRTSSSSFSTEATKSETVSLAPGQSRTVTITSSPRLYNHTVRYTLTRSQDGKSIRITDVTGGVAWAENPFGRTYLAYILELDVVGNAWTRSNNSVVGEFGYSSDDQVLGEGGANVLETSVQDYGEREAVIRSSLFQLTPEQAQAVAESYVLFNINPRTIREVRQSEWNKFPVKFDHIGRLIELPNGERAVVENRSYNDSVDPAGGLLASGFTATVSTRVTAPLDGYLLLNSGELMHLDDGTPAEVN